MRWQQSSGDAPSEGPPKQKQVLIGATLAMLLAALLIVWVLIDDSGSNGGGTTTVASETIEGSGSGEPEVVTVDALLETAEGRETALYWAGLPKDAELELSEPESGRTYLRYLTEGAEAGDPRPFLTVGTYDLDEAAAALRRQGNEPDGVLASTPDDGVVYFNRSEPESVYLAYPGEDVQVEVFAPDFQEALELVTSGEITPVAE